MTTESNRGEFAANEDGARDMELKFSGAILAGDNALLHRDDTSTPLSLLPTIQPAFPIGGDDGALNFTLPIFSHPGVPAPGAPGDFGGQIVFVDSGVHDLQTVLAGIKPGMDVVLLDPHQDALDQIAETLSGHHGVTAVHIIADGRTGEIDFSSGALSLGNLTTGSHAADLATIDKAMSANGDLMIWSCNTGQGAAGQAFIDAMAQHTGADVAASTNLTGAGGNWVLEAHTGPIHATVPLTQDGIHQLDSDGLDLASLSIIYPTFSPNESAGATYAGNYAGISQLGFSYGTAGDGVVDDIFPGYHGPTGSYGGKAANSALPSNFTQFGNDVVFVATDATHGRELWITDGTEGGTHIVDDINPGTGDAFSAPSYFSAIPMTAVGSELFFAANDGTDGVELWATDGTTTHLVKDINPGSAGSNPYSMAAFNGALFFSAEDGTTAGSGHYNEAELWTSDGTTTTKIFTPTLGTNAFYAPGINDVVAAGSHLFFVVDNGLHDSSTQSQIYVSDGTPGGTVRLDAAVTAQNGLDALTNVNGTLFFTMNDGTDGRQIWESNGTDAGTTMVSDFNPGTGFNSASGFVATSSGEIYFAGDDGTHGTQLWETDGTPSGTMMVKEINLTGTALFSGNDLMAIGNELYFAAEDSTSDGEQLWESNGSSAGTQKVDPSAGVANVADLENVNGTLYFVGKGTDHTTDLFKFDGTNIVEVADNFGMNGIVDPFGFLGGGAVVTGEPDAFTTDELTAVTGQNLFSNNGSGPDTDTGGSLSIAEVNDSASNVGNQITLADGSLLKVNSDGTFTWDPNGKFEDLPAAGSGADPTALPNTETFTYELTGATSDTTVTITVTGVDNNDTVIGTNGVDTLNPGTGNDIVRALGGADTINMGANLTAADQIDGGTGNDTVNLNGNYTGGNAVVFNATTMVNVENIVLAGGNNYNLTTNDATVAAGATLLIDGSQLDDAHTMTFNGSAETDGSFIIIGGGGNDTVTGGAGNDVFRMQSAGVDTVNGGAGNDNIHFGSFLTSADSINGGSGTDKLVLNGDYTGAHAVVFSSTTLVNVEDLILYIGNSYDLTTNDATVAAGQTLTVSAATLGAGDTLTFNGSAETDGQFLFAAGAGDDVIHGGAGNDEFKLATGGNDSAFGNGGNDIFVMGGALNAADHIDGGAGADEVTLKGDYTGGNAVVFSATTMVNVEELRMASGHSYNLTTNDATVASGQLLMVNGLSLGAGDSLTFNGSAETNGTFHIGGGAGNDVLTGGAGNDEIRAGDGTNTIDGGGGADILSGGSGADTFVYGAASDSTGLVHDTINGFNAAFDFFDVTGTIGAVEPTVASGTLTQSHFDANLAAAIGAGQLGAHDAVLFTPSSGHYVGHTFLIVDLNGTAGYQAGQDLVIDLAGGSLAGLSATNFI
jgi:ELWxxDGT repeat protein